MSPSVSICIPVYNGERFVGRAIESALAQTQGNLEIIVSENASTDDTLKIVLGFAECDPRIRIVSHPKNIGMIPNWRSALSHAKNDFIVLLMHDDFMEPDFIEKCMRAAQSLHLDVVTGWLKIWNEEGQLVELVRPSSFLNQIAGESRDGCFCFEGSEYAKALVKDIENGFLKFDFSATLVRRELYESIGGLDLALRYCSEAEMFTRLGKRGAKFGFLESFVGNKLGYGKKRQSTVVPFLERWNDFLTIPALMNRNGVISGEQFKAMTAPLVRTLANECQLRGSLNVLAVSSLLFQHFGISRIRSFYLLLMLAAGQKACTWADGLRGPLVRRLVRILLN